MAYSHANQQVVQGIRQIARACAGVDHVNEVLTMHMGPDFILANISLEFADDISSPDVEAKVAMIDQQIKAAFANVKRIFVEAEARRS